MQGERLAFMLFRHLHEFRLVQQVHNTVNCQQRKREKSTTKRKLILKDGENNPFGLYSVHVRQALAIIFNFSVESL